MYVQHRVKVNEAIQGTEDSVRMKVWVPPKNKQENLDLLKDLVLENEKNEKGETLSFVAGPEVSTRPVETTSKKDVEMADEEDAERVEAAQLQLQLENLDMREIRENSESAKNADDSPSD